MRGEPMQVRPKIDLPGANRRTSRRSKADELRATPGGRLLVVLCAFATVCAVALVPMETARAEDLGAVADDYEAGTANVDVGEAPLVDPATLPPTLADAITAGVLAPDAADRITEADYQTMLSWLTDLGVPFWGWDQATWDALVGPSRSQDVSMGTVTYYEFGLPAATARTVLLLPGIGMTKSQWDPAFLDGLAEHFHVIAVDYPGIGDATIDDPSTFLVPDLVDALWEFAQAKDLRGADVIGYAFSGKTSALLLQAHPGYFGRFVDIAGDIDAVDGPVSPVKLAELTSLNELVVAYAAWPHTIWGLANAAAVGFRVLSHTQEPRTEPMMELYRQAEDAWLAGGHATDPIELSTFPYDTLLIAGSLDDVTPPADMAAAASAIASAGNVVVYREYPRAAHTVMFQWRPFVIEDIRVFLSASFPTTTTTTAGPTTTLPLPTPVVTPAFTG